MKDSNGWFRVKDRLPDLYPHEYYGMFSDHILLYGIYDGGNIPQIFIGYMVKGNIFYSNEYGRCEYGEVTHWQPLPHPPIK